MLFDAIPFTDTADFVLSLGSIRVKALQSLHAEQTALHESRNDLNAFENIIVLSNANLTSLHKNAEVDEYD